MKLLLALQYWEGDRKAAEDLARLLAALEPAHSSAADLALITRYDCPTPERKLVEALSAKFNVYTYRSQRRGIGWPGGCNDLWFATMDWIRQMQEAKKIPPYSGVLTFEADSCPLAPNWIDRMREEWEAAKSYVAGAYQPGAPDTSGHINGNCLFSCDPGFLQCIGEVKCPPKNGWDMHLAPMFKHWGWANLEGMRSFWHCPTLMDASLAQLVSDGVYFLHGVKDASVRNFLRKKL